MAMTSDRRASAIWRVLRAFRIAATRLRFLSVFAVVFVILGSWETIRTYWGRLTSASTSEPVISSDTEYFCPMDPGILSDWPSKCPVCNMTLVRRKRGEAVPLPDGVMARMQFTPYRLWLGGIRTEAVDFAPLARTIEIPGIVRGELGGHARVEADVFARELTWIEAGQAVEVVPIHSVGLSAISGKIEEVPKAIEAGSIGKVIVAALGKNDVLGRGERVRIRVRCPVERFEPFRSQPSTPPPLVRGEPRKLYACMEHADVVRDVAGSCPRDGLELMVHPLREDQRVRWWCPMHPAVTADRSGAKCEACGGMELAASRCLLSAAGDCAGGAVLGGDRRWIAVACLCRARSGDVRRQGGHTRGALRCDVSGRFGTRAWGSDRLGRGVSDRRGDEAEPEPGDRLLRCGQGRLGEGASHSGGEGCRSRELGQGSGRGGPAGGAAAEALPGNGKAAGLDGCSAADHGPGPRRISVLQGLLRGGRGGPGNLSGEAARRPSGGTSVIDRIIGWSIRNRAAVLLATLAMACWGAYAAWIAPVDAIPDLSENQVIVHAEWPGQGPTEIEDQVTAPLGMELNGVRGVKTIRSSSDFGVSTLWVIFDESVDVATARRGLADRLASSDVRERLPSGVTPRLAPDGPATGQIFWYTVEGGGLDLGRLRAIQDWYVKPQLAAVSGVAEVASVGGMTSELQIEADPVRLRIEGVGLTDLVAAVASANGASGGGVVLRANAEHVVRGVNWIGDRGGQFDLEAALDDLRRIVVPTLDGRTVLLEDVATARLGPQPRRGALEKDGVEVAGGVVLMANGENPLALTRRLKAKVRELTAGLPAGVRIIPMYDRTPLILGAIETVSGTIIEAMICASLCVLLILRHVRAALLIAVTLPLAAVAAFGGLELLRRLGIADIQVNAMALAGLAISIGVLVDSAIVMTENVLHSLHLRFGDGKILGDVSATVEGACRQVGRPIVFSILIMLLSFLPVFALGGLEGRMFRPLAATKTLAMAASGILAITLVPVLCVMFVRGRARAETASGIVRGTIEVYRPVLDYLLDRPAPLLWVLGTTFILAAAAIGNRWLFLGALGVGSAGRRAHFAPACGPCLGDGLAARRRRSWPIR